MKHLRVRLAVAINSGEEWTAFGGNGYIDARLREEVLGEMQFREDGEGVVHFIEVDVLVPDRVVSQVLEAEVV